MPEMEATHAQRWTQAGVIEADVSGRALPRSRLLVPCRDALADLNARPGEQARALPAVLPLLTLLPVAAGRRSR